MDRIEHAYPAAYHFARVAHKAVGQRRKYTGEPYHYHCLAVAQKVREVVGDSDPAMVGAALLHDVLEDTHVAFEDLAEEFGGDVAMLVWWLTDLCIPQRCARNRAERKELEAQRLAGAPVRAKTIKLADLIDNTSSIVTHDRVFAKIYLREKAAYLQALEGGDARLMSEARATLEKAAADLGVDLSSEALVRA